MSYYKELKTAWKCPEPLKMLLPLTLLKTEIRKHGCDLIGSVTGGEFLYWLCDY
jgi:hypothetical protein